MWQQIYDPFGSQALSALVAVIPIVIFLLGLTVFKLTGLKSALISLIIAVALAILAFHFPVAAAASSILYGFLGGLWPIGWIVLMAVWLYRISVRAGNFEVIKGSVSAISADQRIQVLLIAFCFGGFLEGAAGFGIPIAICAALLVNLGFDPVKAALYALVANAASGAYGAIGIPVINGASQGHVDASALNSMMVPAIQLTSVFVPVIIVMIQDGLRGLKETGLIALVIGVVVSGLQSLLLVTVGPELVDIVPPLVGLVALAVIMRFWQPKHIYREPGAPSIEEASGTKYTASEVAKAWSPFYILSGMILLWSVPAVKALFALADAKKGTDAGALSFTTLPFQMPSLHGVVQQVAPIASEPTAVKVVFTLNLLGASGTAILIAALITTLVSKITWSEAFEELGGTCKQLWGPILMICLVMAVANVMNYSGMISAIALAVAAVGTIFPLFSPIIGWVGVFVTGSVVNNNTLFAGLQATTASQIGASQTLLVASNTTGGVMAKLVSPQSIAIAAAAVGLNGQESKITSAAIKCSVVLLIWSCLWIYLLSLVLPA